MKSTILIIDDEAKLSGLLARLLELEGYIVFKAYTAISGLRILEREDIRLVLCDVQLPDGNGIRLVKKIKEIKKYVEVISLTAFSTVHDRLMALENGAFNYLTKGDDNEQIIPLVYSAIEKANYQYSMSNLNIQ